jgi:carboxyl-terminal processing protease
MKNMRWHRYLFATLGALLLTWNLVVGARTASEISKTRDNVDDAYSNIRILAEVLVQIRQNYVDEAKTGYKQLVYGALHGMLQSLDPHSQFMEPEVFKEMMDDTAGEFGGLGIVIGIRDNVLTVISPMENTPAFKAGVLSGDKIIAINGESTENINLQEAVKRMRGEPGTKVKVRIFRPKTQEIKEMEIERAIIKVDSVKDVKMLEAGIGYIRITQFNEPAAPALAKALEKLTSEGMNALILDLRNNPGGLLSSAVEVAQQFLRAGDKIVSVKGRSTFRSQTEYASKGKKHYLDFPMVVLANEGSASASEIVAGAFQDNHRAIIVGEKTFGKASVQSVLPIGDGSAIRLTTAKYYTPNDRMIHEKGIEPDILIPMSAENWYKIQLKKMREEVGEITEGDTAKEDANLSDIQLERAVDLLKGIMIFHACSTPTTYSSKK